MLKTKRSLPGRRTNRPATTKAGGFTLIEVGLVIALLGVIALMVAQFFVNQVNLGRESRRVSGTVLDMHTIIDASILWQEAYGLWPNDPVTDEIGVLPLVEQGFLSDATLPRNRYVECADCGDYEILGWDRDAGPGGLGDYTTRAVEANDLVIRAEVPRLADAWTIAGQLPQGHVLGLNEETPPTPPFVVEARLYTGGVAAGEFVRLRDEDRTVIFHPDQAAFNVQGGDLQRMGRIAGSEQLPPCPPDGVPGSVACQGPNDDHVTYGSSIVFEEPVCGSGQTPLTDNCRRVCASFENPQRDNCQLRALVSSGPTIVLREGLPLCEAGINTNCLVWRRRTAGPAVVLHGLASPRCRPGQTTNCDARPLCASGRFSPGCRPAGPTVHLQTASARVLIDGDLEISAGSARTGPVALQSDLNELICCARTAPVLIQGSDLDCRGLDPASIRGQAISQCLAEL